MLKLLRLKGQQVNTERERQNGGVTCPNSNLGHVPAFAGTVLGCFYPYDVKGAFVTLGGV